MNNKVTLCSECLRLAEQANGGTWIVPKTCACIFHDRQTEKTFSLTFIGREARAIGIRYRIVKTVQAADKEAAVLKLYETHEHISVISIEERGNQS